MQENNRRIAKNTIILYFRMFLTIIVGLIASRVILSALGEEDYGIYNVIGGVTTIFAFINSSISVSSSRFISFAIGKNDLEYERHLFRHIVYIHYAIAIITIILIEIAGLWFLNNKLVIPEARMDAAFWVFHLSAFTCFLSIISTPYNAMIISHEKLSVFAYISILDSLLRLGICFLIMKSGIDRLVFYAILLATEALLIRLIYMTYCRMKFKTSNGKVVLKKDTFKEIAGFAGWNMFGNLATVTINQGITILLNIFFGPVINASRGLAMQINNMIGTFSDNIRMAINPQITKSYANGDLPNMHNLIRMSSTYPFYLILLCLIPLWLVGDVVLDLWLVDVPEYTLPFMRLGLVYTLVNSFANPVIIGIHATGKIKRFQFMEGIVMLLTLPLAYIFLKCGLSPNYVYYSMIMVAIATQVTRLAIVLPVLNMALKDYILYIILPCLKALVSASIALIISIQFYGRLPVLAFCFCVVGTLCGIYFCGLSIQERIKLKAIVYARLKKRQ